MSIRPVTSGCLATASKRRPPSLQQLLHSAILLGGDTDTIAAMAGAISGAYLGAAAIPGQLLERLENRSQGRSDIERLAKELYQTYLKAVA
jgi:poly(ADP-ribose) glycohydrolase ARH3